MGQKTAETEKIKAGWLVDKRCRKRERLEGLLGKKSRNGGREEN